VGYPLNQGERSVSHFSVLVLIPSDTSDVPEAVETMLAPFDENGQFFREGDENTPPSRWDWWTIGGRWTGSLDGYDPRTDPANLEPCDLCGGTGDRAAWRNEPRQNQVPSGCNGCDGKGIRVKWTLAPHDGDIQPVAAIADGFVPYALVTPDGKWHEKAEMGWFGCPRTDEKPENEWGAEVAKLYYENRQCLAVLVDCHV
jgi:hypothetical protein